MKRGLKLSLALVLLISLAYGGYYLAKWYPVIKPALGAQLEKPKEQSIQIIDTSSIYVYDRRYNKGNLEIMGLIINPEVQYKDSQFKIIGKDMYLRIQVEPNPDKKVKEFGIKVPYEASKIKNIYFQGPTANDKFLKWQNP